MGSYFSSEKQQHDPYEQYIWFQLLMNNKLMIVEKDSVYCSTWFISFIGDNSKMKVREFYNNNEGQYICTFDFNDRRINFYHNGYHKWKIEKLASGEYQIFIMDSEIPNYAYRLIPTKLIL